MSCTKKLEFDMPYGVGIKWDLFYSIIDSEGVETEPDISSYLIYIQVRDSQRSDATVLFQLSTQDVDPDSRIWIEADQVNFPGKFYIQVNEADSMLLEPRMKYYFDIVYDPQNGDPCDFSLKGAYFVRCDIMTQKSEF